MPAPRTDKRTDEAAAAMDSITTALVSALPDEEQAQFHAFIDSLPTPRVRRKSECAGAAK